VRLKEVGDAQRRLVDELAGKISHRLEVVFRELPSADGPNVGLALQERGQRVTMEIPVALLRSAGQDPTAREEIRVRIKARRDRMMFRSHPAPLPKHIQAIADAPFARFGGGHRRGRR
jgi:hypothetical protein